MWLYCFFEGVQWLRQFPKKKSTFIERILIKNGIRGGFVEFMFQERKGERTNKCELESEWVSEWVSERMNEWIIERASWLFIVIIFPLVSGKMHHT